MQDATIRRTELQVVFAAIRRIELFYVSYSYTALTPFTDGNKCIRVAGTNKRVEE